MRSEALPIHADASAGALRLVRGVVFVIWAGVVADTPLHLWTEFPAWMFAPPGVLALLGDASWDAILHPAVLTGLRVLLFAACLWAAFTPRPHRLPMVAVVVGLVLFHGFILAWGGFLNHSRMGPLYMAVVLSLVDHRAARDRPEIAGASLLLMALLLALAYSLIGIHRFLVGGIDIFLNDALRDYMLIRTFEPGRSTFTVAWGLVQIGWLMPILKAGFFVTTVAEVLSPLALFHRRFRWAWLAVIVPFHFVTLFTMNIFFWENLVLIAFLFTGLPSYLEEWWNARGGVKPKSQGVTCPPSATAPSAPPGA